MEEMYLQNQGTVKVPDYRLSKLEFELQISQNEKERNEIINQLHDEIEKEALAPYYKHLKTRFEWFPFKEALYQNLLKINEEEIRCKKEKISEAEKSEETELDLLTTTLDLGDYYAKIIDKDNAVKVYKDALELTQNTGSKIDIYLTLTRIEFFFNNYRMVSKYLGLAHALIEKNGDWERQNTYKKYNGIYLMATKRFSESVNFLIDSLTSFTYTDICSYEHLVHYSILCGVLFLNRVDLKKKIINSSEINSIHSTCPELNPIVNLTRSLYVCDYSKIFVYLLDIHENFLTKNKYLHAHANCLFRMLRAKTYSQLLESYKSLTLKSMVQIFNINESLLEDDLCSFISKKKLNCTIDKVNGLVETKRLDNKNEQYQSLIKQGDGLLNKLQKYCAAVKLVDAEMIP